MKHFSWEVKHESRALRLSCVCYLILLFLALPYAHALSFKAGVNALQARCRGNSHQTTGGASSHSARSWKRSHSTINDTALQIVNNTSVKEYSEGTSVICKELVLPRGYPCEDYSVITEDGFVLALQRIPGGKQGLADNQGDRWRREGRTKRPPVLLMHGIMQGGDSWLLNFPASNTLALTLADAGYDVFLGNFRGTRWGHHTDFPRTDRRYWAWSWEELAARDLPSILRHVYGLTHSKISYVGHSQGTLTLLAALAGDADVAPLLERVVLMCPIAYLGHITSDFLRVFSRIYLDTVVRDTGMHEFNINNKVVERVAGQACARKGVRCNSILAAVTGPNCCITLDRLAVFFQYEFQSTAVKNLAHLAQMVRSGRFGKFDYGWFGNLRRYLSFVPPEYDLQRIPADLPLMVIYGGRDALSDPQDVQKMCDSLPGRPKELYVPEYAHGDFILGTTAKEQVYDHVVAFFDEGIRLSPWISGDEIG